MEIFDPFNATLAQAKAQPDPYSMRGPVHRWGAAQMLIENRAHFESCPIEGVAFCVRHGLVAPDWLADLFIRQYDKVLRCEVGTWDEAFGSAHEPGKHLARLRLRRNYRDRAEALFRPASEAFARAFAPRRIDALLDDATVPGVEQPEEPHLVKFTVDVRDGDRITFAASEDHYLLNPTTQKHVDSGQAYVLDDVAARKIRDRIEAAQSSDIETSSVLPRTRAGRDKAVEILRNEDKEAGRNGITEKQLRTMLSTTRSNKVGFRPYNDKDRSVSKGKIDHDPFNLTKKLIPK